MDQPSPMWNFEASLQITLLRLLLYSRDRLSISSMKHNMIFLKSLQKKKSYIVFLYLIKLCLKALRHTAVVHKKILSYHSGRSIWQNVTQKKLYKHLSLTRHNRQINELLFNMFEWDSFLIACKFQIYFQF